ncbi:MAG: hypothetical protein Q9164_006414 [Protoblastenia rupestris]
MSATSSPPSRDIATLVDDKHYRARRHSLMHPPSIHLSRRRITVPSPLDPEDTIWKPLSLPTPTSSSPAPPCPTPHTPSNILPSTPDTTTTSHATTTAHVSGASEIAASNLTPSDMHVFCNRDSVLYMPYPSPNGAATQKLCKAIHRAWYPRRGESALGPTGACRPGWWFGKAVIVTGYDDAKSGGEGGDGGGIDDGKSERRGIERLLQDLVRLHECLVDALERTVGGSEEGVFLQGMNPRESPAATRGWHWYGLKRTMRDCFVVIDGDAWEREGVMVVWRGNVLAEQLGSGTVVDGGDVDTKKVGMIESKGTWMYSRMRLQEAMLGIMVAEDPRRRQANVEGSEYWAKHFGKGEDDGGGETR